MTFKKIGRAAKIGGALALGGLAMIVAADTAGADAYHKFDENGRYKGVVIKESTQAESPELPDNVYVQPQNLTNLLSIIQTTYNSGAFREAGKIAEDTYRNLPGKNIDAAVWDIKSGYQSFFHSDYTYQLSKGLPDHQAISTARQRAKNAALNMVDHYLKDRPTNDMLKNLRFRIADGIDPDSFDVDKFTEAHALYQKAQGAISKKDYGTASTLMKQAVDIDPSNIDAWFRYGKSIALGAKNKGQNPYQAKLEILQEGYNINPTSGRLKTNIDALKKY